MTGKGERSFCVREQLRHSPYVAAWIYEEKKDRGFGRFDRDIGGYTVALDFTAEDVDRFTSLHTTYITLGSD